MSTTTMQDTKSSATDVFRRGERPAKDDRSLAARQTIVQQEVTPATAVTTAVTSTLANGKTEEEELLTHFEGRVRAAAQRAVKDMIGIGRELAAAKRELGHGLWTRFINERLRFLKPSTVRGLMQIAAYAPFQNADSVSVLPTDQRALVAITRVDPADFDAFVEEHGGDLSKLSRPEIIQAVRARVGGAATTPASARPSNDEIDDLDRLVVDSLEAQVRRMIACAEELVSLHRSIALDPSLISDSLRAELLPLLCELAEIADNHAGFTTASANGPGAWDAGPPLEGNVQSADATEGAVSEASSSSAAPEHNGAAVAVEPTPSGYTGESPDVAADNAAPPGTGGSQPPRPRPQRRGYPRFGTKPHLSPEQKMNERARQLMEAIEARLYEDNDNPIVRHQRDVLGAVTREETRWRPSIIMSGAVLPPLYTVSRDAAAALPGRLERLRWQRVAIQKSADETERDQLPRVNAEINVILCLQGEKDCEEALGAHGTRGSEHLLGDAHG